MKTYRFICELATGGDARSWRNLRSDRAAIEAAQTSLIEGRYKAVTVKRENSVICKLEAAK